MAGTNRNSLLLLLFILLSAVSYGQDKKYVVYFKNKNNSPYAVSDPSQFLSEKAIQRRQKQNINISENDLPVTPQYLDSLTARGAQLLYSLKWLNAAAVVADSAEMVAIHALSFVHHYERVAKEMNARSIHTEGKIAKSKTKKNITSYGNSYNQVHMLEADQMHNDGFHGEGIVIALLDAGFKNASSLSYLNHVYTNNRVLATYDFVDQETDVYDDDEHGLEALSVIAAYREDALIGTAYNASFILLRTEDDFSETEIEEANWARGAEYADSIGADIISSSLGYTTFDIASTNHTYLDMNGQTTIAARTADMAASKGILVICSAGNEGNNGWKYITTPADGDSVLAIGAVDANENYAYFSSTGPTSDGRIKPDLVARGQDVTVGSADGNISSNSGTSFACPLVTGLAAGIWQAYPTLTAAQVFDALRKSASQYKHPDNYKGYGVPGYQRAREYVNDSIFNIGIDFRVFPNPIRDSYICFTSGAEYFNREVGIKMYDLLGKLVAEDKVTVTGVRTESHINVASLRDGVYTLRFYFPDKTVKTKLLKY